MISQKLRPVSLSSLLTWNDHLIKNDILIPCYLSFDTKSYSHLGFSYEFPHDLFCIIKILVKTSVPGIKLILCCKHKSRPIINVGELDETKNQKHAPDILCLFLVTCTDISVLQSSGVTLNSSALAVMTSSMVLSDPIILCYIPV